MNGSLPSFQETLSARSQRTKVAVSWCHLILPVLLVLMTGTHALRAQNVSDTQLQILRSHAELQQFYAMQREFAQNKELERTRVPLYNADLSIAVNRFHKHISDMHYRQVSCSICREYVHKIKELAKKIDQGMN